MPGTAQDSPPIPGHVPGEVLVRTKLHIPAPRRGLVPRSALTTLLQDQTTQRRLTLIDAPAGAGKTTLLSEWHALAGDDLPFAWISLDQSDNDRSRFWSYVIEGLRTVEPQFGGAALDALRV